MVDAKRNSCVNALKDVERGFKEFGFNAGMLRDLLVEVRNKK